MKPEEIRTIQDAQIFCEGVINDFESGICTKDETMNQLLKYTARLNDLHWEVFRLRVINEPELLQL